MKPTVPKQINPFAVACLKALQETGLGIHLSLGGGIGLALFHEFRPTKDVDAWWMSDATEEERQKVIAMLNNTLEKLGEVKVRRFGDVVSLDLYRDGHIVFNFQIARRSAQLQPTLLSPWPPINLDAMEDLVASKMTALVERGLPRDFLDIYEICRQEICSMEKCWKLWEEREKKRGVKNLNMNLAIDAIRMHLKRIEKMRPLNAIEDTKQKQEAEKVRNWFKNEFRP